MNRLELNLLALGRSPLMFGYNAVMESFFARLKVELVYAENYKIAKEACSNLFEYIEIFYNRPRRHSSLGYKSPAQFEENYYAQSSFVSEG